MKQPSQFVLPGPSLIGLESPCEICAATGDGGGDNFWLGFGVGVVFGLCLAAIAYPMIPML